MKYKIAGICFAFLLFMKSLTFAEGEPLSKLVGKLIVFGLQKEVAEALVNVPRTGVDRYESTGAIKPSITGTLLRVEGQFAVIEMREGREVYIPFDKFLFISDAP